MSIGPTKAFATTVVQQDGHQLKDTVGINAGFRDAMKVKLRFIDETFF